MNKSDFRHLERLRVRWVEVDLQKIVFNGHYLMYADTAVAGYWRQLALPYHEAMERLQGDLFVRKATLEYQGSARYDDQLEVGIRCGRIGSSSMQFQVGIFRGDTCLVPGELVYVFADPRTMSSQAVPEVLRSLFAAFEAGEDMLQLNVVSWDEAAASARPLRLQALVQELRLPPELEADADDAQALHAMARNRLGMVVGCGRLLPGTNGVGTLSRMAVHPGVRGAGVGRRVLDSLMRAAHEQGCKQLELQATSAAVPLYLKAGFQRIGLATERAGVSHQAMRRAL